MNVKEVMTRQMITDRFLALLEKAASLSLTDEVDFRGQYPGNSALYKGDGRHRRLLGG